MQASVDLSLIITVTDKLGYHSQ